MAVTNVVKTNRDGSIKIIAGADNLTISLDIGDWAFSEPKAARTIIRDRGAIAGLRKADDEVGECSFTVHFREFTDAAAPNIYDFIYHRASASGYTTVGTSGFEQFLCDIEYKADASAMAGGTHTVTLNKVLLTASFSEGQPDSISVTGEVYGTYTYTNT